ncbi:MAG: 23S rRNA (adenine(2503)-C(2))-methyltransferase RlmN, partial [Flavobacteriia bacterium]
MSTSLTNIRNLSLEELKTSFTEFGEKPFRAKQVWEWLWQKNAHSFEQMSNLSLGCRTWL